MERETKKSRFFFFLRFLSIVFFPPPFLPLNLSTSSSFLSNRGLDRAKASPSARAASKASKDLSKADAELAAALASHDSTSHLVKGWPAAGERDELKAALLSAVRGRISAAAAAVESGSSEKKEGEKEQQVDSSETKLESLRQSILVAPAPAKKPKQLDNVSDATAPPRVDDYYWLRDDSRKSKEVLSHLRAENAYVEASLADTKGVANVLTKELRAAIQEADEGAPVRKSGYWWWWRTREGGEYRQHVRRKVSKSALGRQPTERDAAELVKKAKPEEEEEEEEEKEEIFLDEDARAKGKSFYMTAGVTASPDGSALAWGEDTEGGEKYTLHCVDLKTGAQLLRRPIPSTAGNFVFSSPKKEGASNSSSSSSSPSPSAPTSSRCSSSHLFYTTKDKLDRPCKVWRHELGSDPSGDVCVFHEEDDAFYVSVGRSRDGSLIFISSGSAITTEVHALKADDPDSEIAVLLPRVHDVEYDVGCHSAAGRVSSCCCWWWWWWWRREGKRASKKKKKTQKTQQKTQQQKT